MKERMMFRLFSAITLIALIVIVAACGSNAVDLSGTWSGSSTGSDSRGDEYTETLVWEITQTGNSIDGTETLTGDGYTGSAIISGTLDGNTLTFLVSGEYDTPYDGCTYSLSGEAEVMESSIIGSHESTSACTDGSENSASGSITLNKE